MPKWTLSAGHRRSTLIASALLVFAGLEPSLYAEVQSKESAATISMAAQPMRGQKIFANNCASCHVTDGSKAPPVGMTGEAFAMRWRSANDLYVRILETMPKDKVLSLSEGETADVTSYLLELNGVRLGGRELASDRESSSKILLAPAAEKIPASGLADSAAQGYYSIAQAKRGEAYFQSSCSLCHIAEPKVAKPGEVLDPTLANVSIIESGGVRLGPLHAKSHLAGPIFMQSWTSVGALYNRIRHSMPGYSPDGLDPETYLDITAYVLRMNGFPAGASDLPLDIHQLKAMPLPEPGFTTLFNGRDFSGFGFVVGNDCSPQGCASTVPGSTFGIKDRVLVCSGHPYGYMYTKDKYLNFTLRFEYRFPPWQGMEADDVFWGNSGYFVFITNHEVWPKSIEIEGMEALILRPLGIATTPKYTYDQDAVKRARRPVGDWNSVEITAKDGQILSSLNGVLLSVVTQHEFTQPGHIAFQAEGVPIEWRNIRISGK